MPKHSTTWEDAQIAGLSCDGIADAMTISVDDGWRPCPRCGQRIRLVWHVYVEEETQ